MQNAFISLLTVAAIVAPACGAEWLTDFEAAKKQAAAENKADSKSNNTMGSISHKMLRSAPPVTFCGALASLDNILRSGI